MLVPSAESMVVLSLEANSSVSGEVRLGGPGSAQQNGATGVAPQRLIRFNSTDHFVVAAQQSWASDARHTVRLPVGHMSVGLWTGSHGDRRYQPLTARCGSNQAPRPTGLFRPQPCMRVLAPRCSSLWSTYDCTGQGSPGNSSLHQWRWASNVSEGIAR